MSNKKNNDLIKTRIQSDLLPLVTGTYHQAEFIKFALWYGTPSWYREPKTQKEFGRSIGISEDTLTSWKNNPQFNFFVWQATKEWLKERIPDVIGGLYEKATSNKVGARDVEMCLKIAGLDINSDNKNK